MNVGKLQKANPKIETEGFNELHSVSLTHCLTYDKTNKGRIMFPYTDCALSRRAPET